MAKKEGFRPNWYEEVTPPGTYRSLVKWGDPAGIKHPNSGLVRLIMDQFQLTEADLSTPLNLSLDMVTDSVPCRMPAEHLAFFRALCGDENVLTDTYTRISRSYGKGMLDALRLRRKIIQNLPEVVIAPRSREEIVRLVAYADEHRIPVTVFGGGSTVTRGMETPLGGITVDMSRHMNRVLAFNETDQTITVEAGISGPRLEALLNNAAREFGAARAYTCGHFPQSFEYSSVGGWAVTRGAGQNSTYYGKIEDLVIAQDYVTPIGELRTCPQPRAATGPDFDQVMLGGEGAFGILVSVTLRVFRYMPENRKRFSYMFRTWEEAQAACREIMQAEIGYPSVFRLSDPEETDVAMKLYHIEGTPADTILQKLGYQPMQKCLLLGLTDGEKDFCANLDRKIRRICRQHRAFELSLFGVTKRWEKDRFRDPYLREDLQDFGVLIDTLECGVTWEQMPRVHQEVRAFVKSRPQTVCMTHLSHAYPQGANLYFIFIARIATIKEYLQLQYGILEAITKSGAAISHHHGVGKQTAPWLEECIGKPQMDVVRLLKQHFDPHNIMNPGGTLGLDMSAEQAQKRWSMDLED